MLSHVVLPWLIAATSHAQSDARSAREYSPLARRQIEIFRRAPLGLDHGAERFTRVHSTEDTHFLVQAVGRENTLNKYAVPITDRSMPVVGVTEAPPAAAPYSSLTPWLTVHLTTARLPRAAWPSGKGWKRNVTPLDEQFVTLAVARRELRQPDGTWRERAVRVQRGYERRYMGTLISISLDPAGSDGRFRRLRVAVGGASGALEVPARAGEILGFTADPKCMMVVTSDGRAREYLVGAAGDALILTPGPNRVVDPARLRAEYGRLSGVLRPVDAASAKASECEAKIEGGG